MFIKSYLNSFMAIVIYVDDILIIENDKQESLAFKLFFHASFRLNILDT